MKYLFDSYCKELKTKVLEVGKDYIILEDSIFHSQGGGQPADKGSINGIPVKDVLEAKHFIDIKSFKPGQEVTLKIDWFYRYKLMQAHTGEHLFYQCLNSIKPVSVEKISLTDNESSLFVKGVFDFSDLIKAEELMREKILANLPLTISIGGDLSNVRIKAERVKGDVRVVRIGDFDASACTGTHVSNSGGIVFFLVTGLKRDGEVSRIDFMTGENAVRQALINSMSLVRLSYELSIVPDKLSVSISNSLKERDELRARVKKLGSDLLSIKKFLPINGVILEEFSGLENDKLIKLASELSSDALVVFINDNNLIVAGNNAEIVFNKIIQALGGKGGGKPGLKIGRIDNPNLGKIKALL